MKILVVRVGRTGDMVMTTPAISALLHHYPKAEFTLLTGPEGRRILGDFSPRVRPVWVYDRASRASLFEGSTLRDKIASAQFDHVYCFEYKSRYYRLFDESRAQLHDLRRLKSKGHYAQLCLDLVASGIGSSLASYPLFLPIAAEAEQRSKTELARLGITERTTLVAVHPTFNAAGGRLWPSRHQRNKRWPPESYGTLCDRLRADGARRGRDLRIVMNLLPEERGTGKRIAAFSRGSAEVLSPEPDFQVYKAFLKRADLLVSPDTGPMHVAAALGTPVVALFAGKNPGDCGPFVPDERRRVLRAEDTANPERGLAAIGVDTVYAACIEMLGERPLAEP